MSSGTTRTRPRRGSELVAALAALDGMVRDDDEAGFARMLRDLGRRFGEDRSRLTAAAAGAIRGAADAIGPRDRG
ncbi:MAG: hypothetical protein QM820_26720 [Minicystis sp.]